MITWRILAIAGVTLGAITAAAVAKTYGQDPSIPLAGALLVVALMAAACGRRGRPSPAQLEAAARAHFNARWSGVHPRFRSPWTDLPSRRRALEIAAMRAAFEAARNLS